MGWIIGVMAVVGFAWLMFANESFRRFGFGLIALIVAALAVLWFFGEKDNREREAERARSLSAISASQLVFTGLQLEDQGYGWRLSGSVTNQSPYPIRALTLRVFLQECPDATGQAGCVTTGQDDARFNVEIPARQARQLDTTLQMPNAASLGSGWSWQFVVTAIEADLARDQN